MLENNLSSHLTHGETEIIMTVASASKGCISTVASMVLNHEIDPEEKIKICIHDENSPLNGSVSIKNLLIIAWEGFGCKEIVECFHKLCFYIIHLCEKNQPLPAT